MISDEKFEDWNILQHGLDYENPPIDWYEEMVQCYGRGAVDDSLAGINEL